MTRATPLIILLLSLAMLGPGVALAQPMIHGSLSGTLGPGTYIVDGICGVAAGNSLTIQPGTTILFSGHYNWKIYGQLTAVGTEQDSIKFLRQNPESTCDWGGIKFFAGSSPNSAISYCVFDHAAWMNYPDVYGGAIYIESVAITVSHCFISNCIATSGGGIYITGAAATVSDCIFFNNSAGNGGGLMAYMTTGTNVRNCIFGKNSATST